MPSSNILRWSKKYRIPVKQLEKRWASAKKRAATSGHRGNMKYIMAIFKKQNKIREYVLDFFSNLLENEEPTDVSVVSTTPYPHPYLITIRVTFPNGKTYEEEYRSNTTDIHKFEAALKKGARLKAYHKFKAKATKIS